MSLEKLHDGSRAVRPGLPDPAAVPDPFVLLDRVTAWNKEELTALATARGNWWSLIEAAAQAACWHQRRLSSFSDQVFLLAIDSADLAGTPPAGPVTVTARRSGQSTRAARYAVRLEGQDGRLWAFELTAAHAPYGGEKSPEDMAVNYRRLWQWLSGEQ